MNRKQRNMYQNTSQHNVLYDEQLVKLISKGVKRWNAWKKENAYHSIFLQKANLSEEYLNGIDLSNAHLSGAQLYAVNLSNADLTGVDFTGADLISANLSNANLTDAQFDEDDLEKANLSGANLTRTSFKSANLRWTNFSKSLILNADFDSSSMIYTHFEEATITSCTIFGASIWNVFLENAIQKHFVITDYDEPEISVDDLEIAQFIHLLIRNKNLRKVIDTMTGKAVLLLGRFDDGGKEVLNSIADYLRDKNMIPIIMDFEQPRNKDFTETIRTLAGLCKYIIADVSSPKSVQQELSHIVPVLEIPISIILKNGQEEYSMLRDLSKYPWVNFPVVNYNDTEHLLSLIQLRIIDTLELKNKEIEERKGKLWSN